jgi:hypothetical protein
VSRLLPEPAASAFRSKPAQKVPLAPVRIATAGELVDCFRRFDADERLAVAASTAWRSMVTVTTAPSTS